LVSADFRALFPSAHHIDLIEKLTYPTHHLLIVGVPSEECGSLYGTARQHEGIGLTRAPIDSCCRRKGSEAGLRSKSSVASKSNGADRRVSHLEQSRAVGAEGRNRRPSLRRFSYEEPVLTRRGVVAVSLVGPFRALLSTGLACAVDLRAHLLARAVAMVGWGSVGRRPVGLGQPPARSSVV